MALKIMQKDCCDIYEKFDKQNLMLKNYYYWDVLLRYKQPTLGSCVIILKRHAESFAQVEADELAEFSDVVIDLEKALKKSFNYDKINYMMLMMVDNHVHFHVLPRYQKEQQFQNITFKDKCWPKVCDMEANKEKIKNNF